VRRYSHDYRGGGAVGPCIRPLRDLVAASRLRPGKGALRKSGKPGQHTAPIARSGAIRTAFPIVTFSQDPDRRKDR
jgi:hypothetical protein